jgi:transposase
MGIDYRSVHVKSARRHTTRLSNHIRGVLKTFGMLPGARRRLPFDRRVNTLLADHAEVAPIVQPMLAAWRQLRQQTAAPDKAVRVLVKSSPRARRILDHADIGKYR